MLSKIKRLFIIKTKFEACLIIYALGLGAIERSFEKGEALLRIDRSHGGRKLRRGAGVCKGSHRDRRERERREQCRDAHWGGHLLTRC